MVWGFTNDMREVDQITGHSVVVQKNIQGKDWYVDSTCLHTISAACRVKGVR